VSDGLLGVHSRGPSTQARCQWRAKACKYLFILTHLWLRETGCYVRGCKNDHTPERGLCRIGNIKGRAWPAPGSRPRAPPRRARHSRSPDQALDSVPREFHRLAPEERVEAERFPAGGGRGVEDDELDGPAGEAFHLVDVEAFLQPAPSSAGTPAPWARTSRTSASSTEAGSTTAAKRREGDPGEGVRQGAGLDGELHLRRYPDRRSATAAAPPPPRRRSRSGASVARVKATTAPDSASPRTSSEVSPPSGPTPRVTRRQGPAGRRPSSPSRASSHRQTSSPVAPISRAHGASSRAPRFPGRLPARSAGGLLRNALQTGRGATSGARARVAPPSVRSAAGPRRDARARSPSGRCRPSCRLSERLGQGQVERDSVGSGARLRSALQRGGPRSR